MYESQQHKIHKFKIKYNLSKWHKKKTKITIQNNVWTFDKAYNGLDHYIRLRATIQVRLMPHIQPKIYFCIQCGILTHIEHINMYLLSVDFLHLWYRDIVK